MTALGRVIGLLSVVAIPNKSKANEFKAVVHPVVIVKVNGYKCRALIDTGAGSSYASSTLLDILKQPPIKREIRSVEMMFGTNTKYVGIYQIKMVDVKDEFQIKQK